MQEIQTSLGPIRTLLDQGDVVYSASDVAICLKYSTTNRIVRMLNGRPGLSEHKITTKMGERTMKFINRALLMGILTKVTKSNAEILISELKLDVMTVRFQRKEEATIMDIIMCFHPHLKMTRQFRVGSYRVDLYIHDLNIVVECDEDDHRGYNAELDKSRTVLIDELISPVWVRYNPDDGIRVPVSEIINHLVGKYNSKEARKRDADSKELKLENEDLKKRLREYEEKFEKIRNM